MGEEILPLILDTIKTAGNYRVGRTAIQKIYETGDIKVFSLGKGKGRFTALN